LCTAAGELSWLLTRDYSPKGTLKLVGDRYVWLPKDWLTRG
jgi:hypothetical protein